MKKILVAHDGSKQSFKAIRKAFEIAEKFDSVVTVISVIPELYLTELMEIDRARISETLTGETAKMMEKIKASAKGPRTVRTVIRQGNPAEEILAEAKKIRADLIVTGSHGRHGAEKFLLGSISSKLVDHAGCSILVVK
ncbi:MAG: universal stress protein [Nitrospiraceae bacterium]|nr:universal stress protein [Nitrospiraceae bacterium]